MTSSQTPSLQAFYLLWKRQGDTFLIFQKEKNVPHYSVWPWHLAFIRLVSQFGGQKKDKSSDPAVCFGFASGIKTRALVFLLNTVHLAVNTEKLLIQTERFAAGRSHRRKPAVMFELQMLWKFGNTQPQKVAPANTNQRGERTQPWGTQAWWTQRNT